MSQMLIEGVAVLVAAFLGFETGSLILKKTALSQRAKWILCALFMILGWATFLFIPDYFRKIALIFFLFVAVTLPGNDVLLNRIKRKK